MYKYLLLLLLILQSAGVYAVSCNDIWPQAVTANSSIPSAIPLPATPNQTFPQPLQPVDYYFTGSGSYSLSNNTVRTTTGATTRLFFDGNLFIGNNSVLNSGGPAENFILVVTGSLFVGNNAVINGFVLVGGSVQINNNAVVNGAVTARGAAAIFGSVNYQPDALTRIDGGIVCDGTPAVVELNTHYPLDLCPTDSTLLLDDLIGSYPASGVNIGSAEGVVNQSVQFNGSTDSYASVPAQVLNGLNDFSLSLWFNASSSGGFRDLISASGNGVNHIFELYLNGSDTIRAALLGEYHAFTGAPVISQNQWYHLAFTRSGNQICLFINAQSAGCATALTGALTVERAALGVWWKNDGSFADPLTGQLDEVLVYNGVLAQSAITELYSNQLAGNNYDGSARTDNCIGCLADDFNSSVLSDSWVTARSSGSFTPQIINGRLRLTQAAGNQATSVTYQRLYPAEDNLIIMEFDYWAYGGSGADGLAVVLSDASVTPQPGSFGGPLGYGFKPNINGFAGGWLGFGLDEYGNFSNEGGSVNVGRRRQSVVVRGSGSGTSGYNYLRGTCNNGTTHTSGDCLSPAVDDNQNNPHRYRMTIDSRTAGSTLVSVERDTGNGFVTLIAPFNAQSQPGQAPVPENFFISLTGSTGGSTNIHELDNLNVCALRSSAVGQQIDHFELDYSGQALTCKPETFTIRACLDAACSQLLTDEVVATLADNSGDGFWVGGNTISFIGGTTTADFRLTTAGNVTVGVSGSVPATKPLSQTLCRAGSGTLSAAACTLSFADSGLVFSVPDGVANRPEADINLSAVKKDDATQQCVPEFANVTRQVTFWSDYITPDGAARPVSLPITVNNQDVGLAEAEQIPIALNFNAQGQAAISVNYADAGQVQLNARYSGSAANNDSGLVMNGADQFIRRPLGLCLTTGGECNAADASCPRFKMAGEPFTLSVTAHAYTAASTTICDGPVTPNFAHNNIGLGYQLVAPMVAPVAPVVQLMTTRYNHVAHVNGQTDASQAISEVGIFNFTSAPVSYLAMSDPIPAASSLPTGRFVPADYQLTSATITPACASSGAGFSYMQQPFAAEFTLMARNTAGQRTYNYHGAFANAAIVLQAENDNDGTDLSLRLADTGTGSWQQGMLTHNVSALMFTRNSTVDGPFSQLALAVTVADPDSAGMADADVNVATATDCTADNSCSAKLLQNTDIRFGRMQLSNAYGPETEALPLTLNAQYWNGSEFVINNADSCSALLASSITQPIAFTVEPPLLLATTPTISAGADAGFSTLLNGSSVINQQGRLWLNAPQQRGQGTVEYQVPVWLQYDWNDNGDFTDNPDAQYIFGRYRGNPRQISWQEIFNN